MSETGARARRVKPERDQPVRNPLMPPKTNGVAADAHFDTAMPQGPELGRALKDAVECGVRTAYTVIDDYMRRGYEAARGNGQQSETRGYMRDDKTSYSGWNNNPWAQMGMPGMAMQQWITMMRAWTDAWSAMIPGAWPQQMQQMWNTAMPGFGVPQGAGAPAVSVHVSSYRPADVTAKVLLNPGVDPGQLKVGRLESEGAHAPLAGVSIGFQHGLLHVHVPVSADQPAGRYHGDITSPDGRAAGKLSVFITDLPGQPA